ncbi:MAG: CehA/McbA family metallohydrolase, partial [Flavisolibacter sp.]
FYKGIEYTGDKNWIGPVRKTNGPGNEDNRSTRYELLPSIPYWKEPVMYQTPGEFAIALPIGKWHISIEHGNEFIPLQDEIVVTGRQKELSKNYTLKRWIDLPRLGWYSGDVHVHHPTNKPEFREYLLEYAKAEDVHLVNVLEMGYHLGTEFKQEGFGEKFRVCRGNICLVSGQEEPRSEFGHIIGLNIQHLTRDTSVYNYYDLVFKKLHLQPGAIVGFAHFAFNGSKIQRGFPMYLATGEVDFVELLQFSRINTLDYYDYLNLGFRITAAAGSDVPWGSTMGEVRTFVYTGENFSADSWFSGLKAGHTFVSNGPALFLRVDDKLPGSEIHKSGGSKLTLKVKAIANPGIGIIDRIAIYNNDGLVVEKTNNKNSDSIEINMDHILKKSQWIAAVAYSNNGAVAHTTPVYVIVDGQPTWDRQKGPAIIARQLDLIQKTEDEEKAKVPVDAGILERLEKGRQFYKGLLNEMNAKL